MGSRDMVWVACQQCKGGLGSEGYWHIGWDEKGCDAGCCGGYVQTPNDAVPPGAHVLEEDNPPAACPNFEMCGTRTPQWYLNAHMGRCFHCNLLLRKTLTFQDAAPDWTCPVCTEHAPRSVDHPGECGHRTCVLCLRRLCGMAEVRPGRPSLDPRPFGCPPCPHGNNPDRCPDNPAKNDYDDDNCDDCGGTVRAWQAAAPLAYGIWTERDEEEEKHHHAWAVLPCPICGADAETAPNRSWT